MDNKRILIRKCKWTESEHASKLLHNLETKAQLLPFEKGKGIVSALFLKRPATDGISKQVFLPQDVIDAFSMIDNYGVKTYYSYSIIISASDCNLAQPHNTEARLRHQKSPPAKHNSPE